MRGTDKRSGELFSYVDLQERRRWIALEIARPVYNPRFDRRQELHAELEGIDRTINSIPTTVELPVEWWTLPANHPYRGLAQQLAKAEPEIPQGFEGLEMLAAASDKLPEGIEALRAMFARCADREERTELYRQWRSSFWSRPILPRSITGSRNGRNGGPENWPRCGAPTRSGKPCRRLIYCRDGEPYTKDGHCWAHSIDRKVKARERWLASQRTPEMRRKRSEQMSAAMHRYWAQVRAQDAG
jgi:hypothetical protein